MQGFDFDKHVSRVRKGTPRVFMMCSSTRGYTYVIERLWRRLDPNAIHTFYISTE